jgi:hypothetical protein
MTTKVTSPFQPLAVGDELGRHADLEVARLCVVAESRDIDLARFTGASVNQLRDYSRQAGPRLG